MSTLSQVRCDQCGDRADDFDKATGWIQLSAGGRGGCRDVEILRSTGRGYHQSASKQSFEPLHFCGSQCLVKYIEAI